MIGNIYRPIKIKSLVKKRGYEVKHRVKSNFGGEFNFNQKLYLDYSIKKGGEVIVFEFENLEIKTLHTHKSYKETPTIFKNERGIFEYLENTKEYIKGLDKPIEVEKLRKMYKPSNLSSSNNNLTFDTIVSSAEQDVIKDVLKIKFTLDITNDNKEVLKINTISNTPVIIKRGE